MREMTAVQALSDEIQRMALKVVLAERERDEAKAKQRKAERSEEEMRGAVETYGRVEMLRMFATNERRFVLTIDEWVFAAAGRQGFFESLRKLFDSAEMGLAKRFQLNHRTHPLNVSAAKDVSVVAAAPQPEETP